jgi:hypothetical protein
LHNTLVIRPIWQAASVVCEKMGCGKMIPSLFSETDFSPLNGLITRRWQLDFPCGELT